MPEPVTAENPPDRSAAPRGVRKTAPGPRGVPLLGSYPEMQRKGLLQFYLDNWHRYGDVVRFTVGPFVAHALAHPDAVRHVLAQNRKNYVKGRGYAVVKLLNGAGLLTSEGAYWQRQRRLMQPPFTPRGVTQFAPLMTDLTVAMLDRWQRPAERGEPIDVNAELLRLGMSVIARSMLSLDVDREADELVEAFTDALAFINERVATAVEVPLFVPTPLNRRFNRALRTLDRRVYAIIAARQARANGPDDLLAKLLAARDEETGEQMSARQVRDEVTTIFFAGHETTAQALTWVWYVLATHPEVERRLHAELDAALAGRLPTAHDLPRLPYTRMVVEETLRLYPAVWVFPRQAVADDVIGDYHIPAGSLVFPCAYLTHRHPAFWDQPEAFDPERFAPERSAGRSHYAYFPFGGGQRGCIGSHLALLETLLVLATVAQRFRLRLAPGLRIAPRSSTTLHPDRPVLVTLERR